MEYNKYHEQNVRINRLAKEMVRLFTDGFDIEQSPEYLAVQDEYIQQQVVKMYMDTGFPPPHHTHVG